MRKNLIAIAIISSVLSFVIGHVTNCDCGKGKEIAHDYQLDVDNEGSTLLDNGRIVGRLNYGSNAGLDSLIDFDNQ